MSLFNLRWNESVTCLNFDDVTLSDNFFSNGTRSEHGGGHLFDLKPKVSLMLFHISVCFK